MNSIPLSARLTYNAYKSNAFTITNNNIHKAPLTHRITTKGIKDKKKEYTIVYKNYAEKSFYYAQHKVYILNDLKSKYRQLEDKIIKNVSFCNKKSQEIIIRKIKNNLSKPNKIQKKRKEEININYTNVTPKKYSRKSQSISTEGITALTNHKNKTVKKVKNRIDITRGIEREEKEKKYVQATKETRENNNQNNTKKANLNYISQSLSKNKRNTKLRKEINNKTLESTFTPKTNHRYQKIAKCSKKKNTLSQQIQKENISSKKTKKKYTNDTITLENLTNIKKKTKKDSFYYGINRNYIIRQKQQKKINEIRDHWTGELIQLSIDKKRSLSKNNNEPLYKININDKGAWNENCVNSVCLTERTKDILLTLLS